MTRLFVLGGARSGKSRYAQQRAEALAGRHVFIATAEAWDAEMAERIARHRADRDTRWETVDAPRDLAAALDAASGTGAVVLVDCLTLWASNLLLADADMEEATDELRAAIARFDGGLILVANETGFGIVPDNALARRFRDAAGRINQAVAATADEVMLVVAGLPMRVK
ncbi:MAG: bifunctional adenosylcobinamide kinase/adenosylcobinamide-phosphate guanylyltransferase [Sphingomonas sp.]|uniref:bifunctional adenosylcobinamide kinase/adenosylcobinamide-phosphate guanylyltransferase n=1 Tax=unclassified Sphingomonas TaxID=196159 RepID=UPI002455FA51|nr:MULTISPECIES: bifunctional adenosylcobinamide kinase/adenosylcobinamide-phosphate guanylyltransferase [unclassified Sphingomonas]MBQ1498372.1 bifunctional adenosylcobinamide kinase/adenosylcobinamide-phosphate guanylyltransferase [Sphingomonas sp.]MDH4746486.1 bifunctional adenosylcobinamide kinase/adenosylcobinamide-phosphate guanylyltransferase [Sphingomonas sp. CBMAI 2297]